MAVPMGLLWWMLAPVATLQKRADGVFSAGGSPESAVAADGWFAVCALAAGVVTALVSAVLLRASRLGVLGGLTVGGLVASVLAWRLGVLLGPAPITESAGAVEVGARFDGPLGLSARGVLLAWPMASVIAFFAAAAGIESPERADEPVSPGDGPQRYGPPSP